MERQLKIATLRVGDAALVVEPLVESRRMGEFLTDPINAEMTATAVKRELYCNQTT